MDVSFRHRRYFPVKTPAVSKKLRRRTFPALTRRGTFRSAGGARPPQEKCNTSSRPFAVPANVVSFSRTSALPFVDWEWGGRFSDIRGSVAREPGTWWTLTFYRPGCRCRCEAVRLTCMPLVGPAGMAMEVIIEKRIPPLSIRRKRFVLFKSPVDRRLLCGLDLMAGGSAGELRDRPNRRVRNMFLETVRSRARIPEGRYMQSSQLKRWVSVDRHAGRLVRFDGPGTSTSPRCPDAGCEVSAVGDRNGIGGSGCKGRTYCDTKRHLRSQISGTS